MQIASTYSYRYAEAIMQAAFKQESAEIRLALETTPWVTIDPPVTRIRDGRTVLVKSIDQVKTNARLDAAFRAQNWQYHPNIVSRASSELVADFKKTAVQVEVQFGNMARWYTDVFKFLLSYAADDIDVGVLIVPMHATANKIDENVVYYERVLRELPHAKMAITIPVWVIGVS